MEGVGEMGQVKPGFDQSCGEVPWAGPELPGHNTSGFVL